MFAALTESGITRRAYENGLLNLEFWNPRDYATDKHKTVDDRPYGGGPGMVMQVGPLLAATEAAKAAAKSATVAKEALPAAKETKVIFVSPQGRRIDQKAIQSLALEQRLIFVAGRYEGVDERFIDLIVDEEWSIGDYVLSGGELAIMVIIDAITRLIPGALGHEMSAQEDSFSQVLLDCPHYTRPPNYAGLEVPEVLMSGDHAEIARWRLMQSLGRTWLRRPDLLEKLTLDEESKKLLHEFKKL